MRALAVLVLLAAAGGCGGSIEQRAHGDDGGTRDVAPGVEAAAGSDSGPGPDGTAPGDGSGPDATPGDASSPDAAPTSTFLRVGYWPSWVDGEENIRFDLLTHVNYAFVLPTASGGLTGLDNPGQLDNLVSLAHAQGVKVSISIGGWNDGDDSAFHALASAAGTRTTFVDTVMSFVATHGLDGVDIDWEYPDSGSSANDYLALMTALGTRLHGQGKLLTAAVVSEGSTGDGVLASVFDLVDWLNLMAYDGEPNSPYSLAVAAIDYWQGRGLPAAKTVLGVPFYGREPYTSYADLVAQDSTAPQKDQIGTIYYNGIPTIKQKTALAASRGAGIMIWELSMDTSDETSLLRAINEASPP